MWAMSSSKRTPSAGTDPAQESEEMSRADATNGERPEQPESRQHAVAERRRHGEHPVGEEQAETNREEEPPV